MLRPFLTIACLSVAACSTADDPAGPDVRAELPPGSGIATVGESILVQGDDGMHAYSPADGELRRLVDDRYRACPWTNPWRSPSEKDEVHVTYVGRVAYVHQSLCGLFAISLDDPTKETAIIVIDGASDAPTTTNARWGDGTPARVDAVFGIAVAGDGPGEDAVVCLSTGGSAWDDLELWTVGKDGKPHERLLTSDAIDCEEIVQAGGAIFFSATVGGLQRFDRATGAVTHIGPTTARPRSLRTTSSHLYYLDDSENGELRRVGLDGNGDTKIERDPADRDWISSFVATDREVFLATQTKISRIPLDGPITTLFGGSPNHRIVTEDGLAMLGNDLWFVWSDGRKRELARVPF